MILLSDIFRMLATGEFSTLAVTRDGSGSIHEKEWRTVIDHLNLGIVEIHKRLTLYTREIVLNARPDVEIYYIRPQMVAPSDVYLNSRQYLSKPPGGYQGQLNLVEIKGVYGADDLEIKINKHGTTPQIKQLAFDTLQIKGLTADTPLSIVYQSYPDKIRMQDGFDITTYVVYIPETILEALLNFIASRVYKPTGSNDSTANADKSNDYHARYELAMTRLSVLGLGIQDDDTDLDKFDREGWT